MRVWRSREGEPRLHGNGVVLGRRIVVGDSGGIRRRTDAPSLNSEAGLRAAYDAFGGELYRMTRRALNDDGLAEEAVQETFLRAWRAADRYDPRRSSLRTWMFAIARNVTIDLARARSARPERTGQEVEHTQAVKDTTEEALRSWEMEEALRRHRSTPSSRDSGDLLSRQAVRGGRRRGRCPGWHHA